MTLLRLPRIPSALCALAAVTLAPLNGWSQEPALQVDWFQSPINGHWFGVDFTTGTWSYSESRANSLGGHLAVIRNQNEQDWLESSLQAYLLGNGAWIGLTDVAEEGVFEWSSGDQSTYRNWHGGQPDNYGSNEHFVHLTGPTWGPVGSPTGFWNDAPDANGPIRPLIELPAKPATGWSWPQAVPTGARPLYGCLADLDGDGDLDYASPDAEECCSGGNADSVSIHLNDGAGNFAAGPVISVPGEPHQLVSMDLDQDGDLDIVYACASGEDLGWLANDGSGGFASAQSLDNGLDFHGLAVADINGDGVEDLLAATFTAPGQVLAYSGLVGGGLSPATVIDDTAGNRALFVTTGDLNGDGALDLVVDYRDSNRVSIFLNDGSGQFPQRIDLSIGAEPFGCSLADLDVDGDLDLLVPARTANRLEVWHNDGAGRFQKFADYPAGTRPHFSLTADFDGDGVSDVIVPSHASDDVRIFYGDGVGGLTSGEIFTGHDYALFCATGDLDSNGSPDLVVARHDAASLAVWKNRRDFDCNQNGVPDVDDIASGTAQDCNANGIPDSCDIAAGESLDCNSNGIPDECDLVSGSATDCNGNGVPDSCDLAAGTSLDCNANGIPDECDIAAGASDCNADGIPDACQITDDATLDLNANGVLDSCESIGTNYCSPAIANSTGAPAAILALGSEALASSDLTMTVSGLPSNTFAMFVTSQTQGYAFPIPGSQGALCVAGFPGRFNRPGQIQSSGSSGTLVFPVDLTSLPTPIGFTAAQPGETWNFQAWYRDANPTVTSNFTDAVGITFQ